MNDMSKIEAAPPAVYAAIAAVMAHMAKEGIGKDRRSGDGGGPKFAFRGIDDVYNALAPVMAANQLMMLPRMISRNQQERQTRSGGVMFYTTVEAEFDIVSGVDGSRHTIRTFGEAMDSSDKSTNKAMSAAFKYAAMQAFCIPTEGDNDADSTTHEVKPRNQDGQQRGGGQRRNTEQRQGEGRGRPDNRREPGQRDAGQRQRRGPEPGEMPDAEWATLCQLVKATKSNTTKMLDYFQVKSLRHLNMDQYREAVDSLNTQLEKMAKEQTNGRGRGDDINPDDINL